MSLFEMFRGKTIEVQSKEKVFPIFTKVHSITDVLKGLNGEAILILNRVSFEVAQWIRENPARCTLYTMEPSTLEEFDAIKNLRTVCEIYIVPSIDMNYIHCNDTLYIIPNQFSNSAAPNVVMIASMSKKEIDTHIAIDMGKFAEQLGLEQRVPNESATIDTTEQPPSDPFNEDAELRLLREEITKYMNDRYCIVKTEMPNASVERKTIPLTPFYEKNRIAQGKLRGTWAVFDREDLSKIMDCGIAQRALSFLSKQYTVTIENAYKLIRKDKLEEYKQKIKTIEKEYCLYLRGENVDKVGTERVSVKFSPKEAIEISLDELTEYLYSIPQKSPPKYTVESFVSNAWEKIMSSITNAETKTLVSALSEEQLKDKGYVKKLMKATTENSTLYDECLLDLLRRYVEMLSNR